MIDTLKYIAAHYGDDVLKDGTKLLAYYTDLAPRENTHRQMLEFLVKCNGNEKLLEVRDKSLREQQACVNMLIHQLTTQLLMSQDAAYTVCHCFLQAIGGAPVQKPEIAATPPVVATPKPRSRGKSIALAIIVAHITIALLIAVICATLLSQ